MNSHIKGVLIGLLSLLPLVLLSQAPCPNDNPFNGFPNPLNPSGVGAPNSTTSTNTWGGDYVQTNVTSGNTYSWTTCGNTTFDTELTLFIDGTSTLLAANSSFCGSQAEITWTASFTGMTRLLLDQNPCATNSTHHPITVTLLGALSAEALHLSGSRNDYGNSLGWRLDYPENYESVTIERGKDGQSFEDLATLPVPKGEEENPFFSWEDAFPPDSRNYYRLRIRGTNGQLSFSNVVEIAHDVTPELNVWPNPSTGNVRVAFSGGEGPLHWEVYGMGGQKVAAGQDDHESSLWQYHLSLPNAGAGKYLLTVRRGEILQTKMIAILPTE